MIIPMSLLTLKRGYGVSDTTAILFSLCQFLTMIGMSYSCGPLIKKYGPRKVIIFSYLLFLPVALFWIVLPSTGFLSGWKWLLVLLPGVLAVVLYYMVNPNLRSSAMQNEVGDMVYAMPFMQLQARLYNNGACTYGAHLYDYAAYLGQDWLMGTMLDLNALRAQGYMAVDVCASNSYLIGQADIYYHDGRISVTLSLNPAANAELHSLSIYVNTHCATLGSAMDGTAYGQGEWIPVGDAASALLYMPITLSYDPSSLSTFGYDLSHGYLLRQLELWQENLLGM